MMEPPGAGSPDWSHCPNCKLLKFEIRKNVEAFRTLATFNPELSADIVLKIIDKLVGTKEDDKVTNPHRSEDNITNSHCHDNNDPTPPPSSVAVAGSSKSTNHDGLQSMEQSVSKHPKTLRDDGQTARLENDDFISMDNQDQGHNDQSFNETVDKIHNPSTDHLDDDEQSTTNLAMKKLGKIGPSISNEICPSTPTLPSETEDNLLTTEKLKAADGQIVITETDGPQKFECLICHHRMSRRTEARFHVRRVHFGDRQPCPNCLEKFSNTRSLKLHMPKCTADQKNQKMNVNLQNLETRTSTNIVKNIFPSISNQNVQKTFKMADGDHLTVRNGFKNLDLKRSMRVRVRLERLQNSAPTATTKPTNNVIESIPATSSSQSDPNAPNNDSEVIMQEPRDLKILVHDVASQSKEPVTMAMAMDHGTGCSLDMKFGAQKNLQIPQPPPDSTHNKETFLEMEEKNKILKVSTSKKRKKKSRPIPSRTPVAEIYAKIGKVSRSTAQIPRTNNGSATFQLSSRYECLECHKDFVNRDTAARHVRGVHLKEYQVTCPDCGLVLVHHSVLERHARQLHSKLFKERLIKFRGKI